MRIRNVNRLTSAISAILLAGGQIGMVQAADEDYSNIAAPPKFTPSTESYPPPPPGGWEGVVDSIDKQIEKDIQETESGRPAAVTPMAGSGAQTGSTSRFPQFQDPPEWGQPPARVDRGMPERPTWPERDTVSQPDWAQGQESQSGGSHFAPREWGGGPMPEPPEWGDRKIPEPPEWAARDIPEPPTWGDTAEPQPPAWAGRNIPDPPEWSQGQPTYPPPRYDRGPSYRTPWDSGRGPSYGRPPYGSSRGPSFRGPWDSGRRGRGDDFSPFGGSGPSFDAPWDSGRGGRSMPWGSRKGRGGWMDKDWFGDQWDDMLNAPSEMGEMPGGWYAPSVSVPNPVDVGDELGTAAEDVPGQMRNVYEDNRRYNRGYDRYDRYDDRYRR